MRDILCNCCWLTVCIFVVVLCVLLSYVYCCTVWALLLFFFFNLDAGLLEGPATGHLDTGFS